MRSGGTADGVLRERAKIKAEDRARAKAQQERQFGTGDVYGDPNWQPPMHAATRDGRPVTVSFGKGPRQGQTLIASGHVSAQSFYEKHEDGAKGHDHYLIDGKPAGKGDRGRLID